MKFKLIAKSSECSARLGEITTPHGPVTTPVFMPVGTQATVKTITPEELYKIKTEIILANTYHLYLRPGIEVIQKTGGLHKFMNWDKPILTDSGGFQIFSLSSLRKITTEGVTFKSHIDGSVHKFTPEKVIQIQQILGSDIIMPLDECLPYPCDYNDAKKSLKITHDWAKRSKKTIKNKKQTLFGIVQGGMFKDLRKESADFLVDLNFPGYSIGGLSVGEPKNLMYEILGYTASLLPENKPRYVMGIGTPLDFFESVERGIDMFDCVLPTRIARTGTVFTHYGKLVLKNSCFTSDFKPLDSKCNCYVCKKFSRAYLRHLFISDEILGPRLATYHNLYFMLDLIKKIRQAIKKNSFLKFKKQFLEKYHSI